VRSLRQILVVGAGGHGQVVADIILAMRSAGDPVGLAGFLDDDSRLYGKAFLGSQVYGSVADVATIPHDGIVVAIGDNRTRARVTRDLKTKHEALFAVVHPRAIIGTDIEISPGSMICGGVVVNTASRIGEGSILNTGCTVDHHNVIGDYAHIAPGAHLGGDVAVGEGAFVCVGASVAPQRKIGAWSIVGAGAAVIRDVPDGVTVVGVPAHPLCRR
jgi:sugar O-acyltransferase (sialic acid O-acetyltransferase NeuD family)